MLNNNNNNNKIYFYLLIWFVWLHLQKNRKGFYGIAMEWLNPHYNHTTTIDSFPLELPI